MRTLRLLSTPISYRLPEDKLIWHWEKDAEYSVRTAYHILYEDRLKDLPGPSHIPDFNLWKEIWYGPAPNRIRNFLWRMAKNILPTKVNLSKKGAQIDLICHLCHQAVERTEHLFMQCPTASVVWFSFPLGIHVPLCIELNAWLLSWLTCQDKLATQLFCTTLWKLWQARNQAVFKNQIFNPIVVAELAASYGEEFNQANPTIAGQLKQSCRKLV